MQWPPSRSQFDMGKPARAGGGGGGGGARGAAAAVVCVCGVCVCGGGGAETNSRCTGVGFEPTFVTTGHILRALVRCCACRNPLPRSPSVMGWHTSTGRRRYSRSSPVS